MKKIFSIACLCIVCALSVFGENSDPYKGTKGLEYIFNPELKRAYLAGRGRASGGDIIVPKLVRYNGEDYRVFSIKEEAFFGDLKLKSIELPEGCALIESWAFDSCVNLIRCVLPSMREIYDGAFCYCSKLNSINLHDSLTYVGDAVFFGTAFQYPLYNKWGFFYMPSTFKGEYVVPDGIVEICGSAFEKCTGLTSVVFPKTLWNISDFAFADCTNLSKVEFLHDSIQGFGEGCFASCSSLQSIKIPEGVCDISYKMFERCTSLQFVSLPKSLLNIRESAFGGCEKLSDIILPNKLKTIENYAFAVCTNLNQIILPNSVVDVGDAVFIGCKKFTKPVFNNTIFAFLPPSYQGTYIVQEGIKKIAGYAFYDVKNLTSIKLPNSVVDLGHFACVNSNLKSPLYNKHVFAYMPADYKGNYSIPEGIHLIGGGAFADCKLLKSVTFPNSVTDIRPMAFYECYSLRDVVIPSNVTKLAENAFPNTCVVIQE